MKQLTKQEMQNLTGGGETSTPPPQLINMSFGWADILGPLDHGGGLHDLPNTDLNFDIVDSIGPMDHGGG